MQHATTFRCQTRLGHDRRVGLPLALAAMVLSLLAPLAIAMVPAGAAAQEQSLEALPLKSRHLGASRAAATRYPRSEDDQAVVDGWPLYRTERGQAAFNDAMATLKATEGPAPAAAAFKGCRALACHLTLPRLGKDGWLPPGRLWVSPTEYVVLAHSPRRREASSERRRRSGAMRYFVLHEFHNSSRNTDAYDTVSSHRASVFVPFYMSKQRTDARGRQFVVVLQVAPHDVVSIHASNMGSAGPGLEVAKGPTDALEPLQEQAGILVATMVKTAVPRLEVVNHRGAEGRPMLEAYQQRLAALRKQSRPPVALPFWPASAERVASAAGRLGDLIAGHGPSPPVALAERGIVPRAVRSASLVHAAAGQDGAVAAEPTLIEPVTRVIPRVCAPGETDPAGGGCGWMVRRAD